VSDVSIEAAIQHLVSTYGTWFVAGVVALESMGIPLPGETTLMAAALYAGATGRLDVLDVIGAAAAGGIVGDNLGFWIGRRLGYRWILRHQSTFHLTPRRLKLGQYLFRKHGGKIVFFGRFIAVLRAWAALLAGINCMPRKRFLVFNATGGIVWASVYGFGAYKFGEKLTHVLGAVGIFLAIGAALLVIVGLMLARKYEERLEEEAERALPGPLPTE
jgi:membrane protein DedA with SNARE-associated domain